MQRIIPDQEKAILLTDLLNEIESSKNPFHGSQGNPLIRAQVGMNSEGKLDIRLYAASTVRDLLLDKKIKFTESKGFKNNDVHHFTINADDFAKLITPSSSYHHVIKNTLKK